MEQAENAITGVGFQPDFVGLKIEVVLTVTQCMTMQLEEQLNKLSNTSGTQELKHRIYIV